MLIYPAMDILDGRVVRLARGDFNEATFYSDAPLRIFEQFAKAGAAWVHIVDLDGAKARKPSQHVFRKSLSPLIDIKAQVAGGVRTRAQIEGLLAAGAERVVVGAAAVEEPEIARSFLVELGAEKITLALDVRMQGRAPFVVTNAWRDTTQTSLFDAIAAFDGAPLVHILVTNVERDGVLEGPDFSLYQEIRRRRPDLKLQASGGVRDAADINKLKEIGADGVIIGRALYEGRIALDEALNAGA